MKNNPIALFGGTFDPIHNGHTTVAADAANRLDVQQLVFIPAKKSPLKAQSPHVSDAIRVQLIQHAIDDIPLFTLHTCELERPAPSYTLDTINFFHSAYGPHIKLYWLIGADVVTELAHWYRIQELIERCTLVTMVRSGCSFPDFSSLRTVVSTTDVKSLEEHVLQTPDVPISSTEIRRRLKNGEDVRGMLNPAVLETIQNHRLYQ